MLRCIAPICTVGQLMLVVPGLAQPIHLSVRPGLLWICMRAGQYRDIIITSTPDEVCQTPCERVLDGFPISAVSAGGGLACLVPGAGGNDDRLTWEDITYDVAATKIPPRLCDGSLVCSGMVRNDSLWDGSSISMETLQNFRGIVVWQSGFVMHWHHDPAAAVLRRVHVFAPHLNSREQPGALRLRWDDPK